MKFVSQNPTLSPSAEQRAALLSLEELTIGFPVDVSLEADGSIDFREAPAFGLILELRHLLEKSLAEPVHVRSFYGDYELVATMEESRLVLEESGSSARLTTTKERLRAGLDEWAMHAVMASLRSYPALADNASFTHLKTRCL